MRNRYLDKVHKIPDYTPAPAAMKHYSIRTVADLDLGSYQNAVLLLGKEITDDGQIASLIPTKVWLTCLSNKASCKLGNIA